MRHGLMNRTASFLSALMLMLAGSDAAAQFHTETFDTDTFKDVAATSADWNTGTGELGLFPFSPSLVGGYATPGAALDVAVRGNLAFVATGPSGLIILDVTDSATPSLVGTYTPPSSVFKVAVDGDRAYLACGTAGLYAVDITDPSTPTLAGSYDTSGYAYAVDVEAGLAVVADGTAGVVVFDVTNPTPAFLGSLDTPVLATGIAIENRIVAVADDAGGLLAADVSSPTTPFVIGSAATSGSALDVALAGSTAYVSLGTAGLGIFDVYIYKDPVLRGSLDTIGGTYDVYVEGGTAYLADYALGLQEVDVSNRYSPTLVRTMATPGSPRAVAGFGNHILVADYTAGLQAVEVDALTAPFTWWSQDGLGSPRKVVMDGNRFFVGQGGDGFRCGYIYAPDVVDLGNLFSTSATVTDGVFDGGLLFVATPFGVESYDVSAGDPTFIYSRDYQALSNDFSRRLDVTGNYLIASGASGLEILSFDGQGIMSSVGSYAMSRLRDMAIRDGFLYGVTTDWDLVVLDVRNPASPGAVGSVALPNGGGYALDLQGTLAVVANPIGGVVLVDVTDRASPVVLGGAGMGVITPTDVAVAGHYALVAAGDDAMRIVDFSDPLGPVEVFRHDTPDSTFGIGVSGDFALVAHGADGLRFYQIFQNEVRGERNLATSLPVAVTPDEVSVVRLTAAPIGDMSWEITADGGANWQPVQNLGVPLDIAAPGTDIRWRNELQWTPTALPSVPELTVEWYSDHGPIRAITDAPDDQGGWLRLEFVRSGFDFAEEDSLPVTGYWIHRRIDDVALQERVKAAAGAKVLPGATTEPELSALGTPVVLGDRRFLVSAAATAMPPGVWEVVGSVPAQQQNTYHAAIPTTRDSTAAGPGWSVFVVTTHTTSPSVWFASRPDSGYSVDNIAPGVPQGLAAAYTAGGVTLDWDDASEEDFQFYRVYRSTDSSFAPGPQDLIGETASSTWNDPTAAPWDYHYKVTALDHAGNESEPGAPGTLAGVPGEIAPLRTALLGAAPNPFNPATRLSFDLAAAGPVSVRIYSLDGRLVTTLVDDRLEAGSHAVNWNGRDARGRMAAAGVYLYQLRASGLVQTRRMTLLK